MQPGTPDQQDKLLPLRRELRLYPVDAEQGSSSWTLEDPVRNLYFRLGRSQVEQLARWDSGSINNLQERLQQEAGLEVSATAISNFQRFLLTNALLDPADPLVQSFLDQRGQRKNSWWKLLLQNYIFFRIPLWRPQRFLTATLPWVRPLATPGAACVYLLLLVLALLQLTPQWGTFLDSFAYFVSWEGAAAYLVVLFAVKFLHELGHAYTATAYGLKVPVIGIALIVLWPMLYSDNSDAWKAEHRSTRIKIVLAGILVELCVAIIATFLWTLCQPGIFRSLCFVLATSSWLHSLLINLSPFMRFDGYYLLADLLSVPNLAPRAFALGRWQLRRLLWGFTESKPEYVGARLELILTIYCYTTWLYRLMLFTGIALMVYHLTFKALGLILFAIEIYTFVMKPITTEIYTWWQQRQLIGNQGHALLTLLLILSGCALMLVPLPTRIIIPAQLTARDYQRIFTPFAAQITRIHVHDGQAVQPGDVLFTLSSQQLDAQQGIVELQIEAFKIQLQRDLVAKHRLEASAITENQLTAALVKAKGLQQQQEQLQIRATMPGHVEQLSPGIHAGSWVGLGQQLGLVVHSQGTKLVGSIEEQDLELLPSQVSGAFYAESGDLPKLICKLTFLDSSNQTHLEPATLAAPFGGRIPATRSEDKLVPTETRYRIEFSPLTQVQTGTSRRGTIFIRGKAMSLLQRLWRLLAPGIIREGNLT